MQGSGANSLEITLGEKSSKKKPLSRIAFIQRSQISKTSFDSDLNLKVIRKTVSTPPRQQAQPWERRAWKEEQKMWKKTSKKTNVEITTGVYEFTRWGRPTKPKGKPTISSHPSHFSILYTRAAQCFYQGPLTYFSYDFKKNSAYQRGIIAPLLQLMRTAAPSLPGSP